MNATNARPALPDLVRRTDDFTEAVLKALRNEPMIVGADPDGRAEADLRAAVRLLVGTVLACTTEGRALNPLEIEAVHQMGRDRLGTLLTPDRMLHLSRISARVLHRLIVTEIRESGNRGANRIELVHTVTGAVLAITSQIGAELFGAHLRGHRGAPMLADEDDVFGKLLSGTVHQNSARDSAARKGIVIGTVNTVVIVTTFGVALGEPYPALEPLAEAVRRTFSSGAYHPTIDVRADEVVAIVPTDRPVRPRELCKGLDGSLSQAGIVAPARAVAAAGRPGTGIQGVSESYAQACRVLDVLGKAASLGPVLAYDDAVPYILLLADPAASLTAFRACIAPLQDHDPASRTPLVEALESLLASAGNVVESAKRLGIHRHTMTARLRRIAELTGYDPMDAEDRVLFQMGLRASRLVAGLT